jgi:hypothetical protein
MLLGDFLDDVSEEYPDAFLRGVINQGDQWYSSGLFRPALFKDFDNPDVEGWKKLSINWHDDDDAVEQIRSVCDRNGMKRYVGGIAAVKRSDLDLFKNHQNHCGFIGYEWDKLPENRHHGNIKLKDEGNSKIRYEMLCNHLASVAYRYE